MVAGNRVQRKPDHMPGEREAQVAGGLVYKVNQTRFDILVVLRGPEGFAVQRADQVSIRDFVVVPNVAGDQAIINAYKALCARPAESA